MNYISYQHIERINTPGTAGIEYGMCYIFPKLDGTNSVMWLNDDGTLGGGSRKRILSLDNDNANFYNDYVLGNQERNLKFFGTEKPIITFRIFGFTFHSFFSNTTRTGSGNNNFIARSPVCRSSYAKFIGCL